MAEFNDDPMVLSRTQSDTADAVVEAVEDYGYDARLWTRPGYCRVYVSRSRQDCGYVEIDSDGDRTYVLSRNKAGIRNHIEAAL